MNINGYWLGGAITIWSALIFDTIKYMFLNYPETMFGSVISIIEISLFIIFMGLAFKENKKWEKTLKRLRIF